VFGLGADVIAGFPGETEDDHRETLSLVSALPFTSLHVFPYSPRPGTAAQRIAEPVPSADVARRATELRDEGARLGQAYRARRDGGEADVIIIGDRAHRSGLTEDYVSVIPADDALSRGSRMRMRLTMRDGVLVARSKEC